MIEDVRSFIQACSTCAQSMSSRQQPAGFLQPLHIPSWPWSHLSVDFITGLPPSQGLTTILVVVDHFSKAAHFITLPKLPSAKETADLMITHVFRLHRLPQDIVSNHGPQFVAWYWKAFCSLLEEVSVSLSSAFHPQREQANKELEKFLHCFVSTQASNWSKFLIWAD